MPPAGKCIYTKFNSPVFNNQSLTHSVLWTLQIQTSVFQMRTPNSKILTYEYQNSTSKGRLTSVHLSIVNMVYGLMGDYTRLYIKPIHSLYVYCPYIILERVEMEYVLFRLFLHHFDKLCKHRNTLI